MALARAVYTTVARLTMSEYILPVITSLCTYSAKATK